MMHMQCTPFALYIKWKPPNEQAPNEFECNFDSMPNRNICTQALQGKTHDHTVSIGILCLDYFEIGEFLVNKN